MKDFLVRMVRKEEILIRADSAKDAAAMVTQFPMNCWEDKFELYIEAADNKTDRCGEGVKSPSQSGKKSKKKGRWKWKCLCEDHCKDDDIPF